MKKNLILFITMLLFACNNQSDSIESQNSNSDLTVFLNNYNTTYQKLLIASNDAEWKANTYIIVGDTATENEVKRANKAYADFTGSTENIESARKFLENKENLSDLQIRELEAILYNAGSNPATAGDIIDKKIAAENKQNTELFSFRFTINGDTVSTNDIDEILNSSNNLNERLLAWEASKEVGAKLKDGLANLQNLRNASVRALGYDDFFQYQVSDYGMSTDEMLEVCHNMINELWHLYRELHTWARYTLAEKYHTEVPDLIPAHWLPNRWGQDWLGLVDVEGLDIDQKLKDHGAEWIAQQGEEFYKSIGFGSLPQSFWEKSSLYPPPDGVQWTKNNHASAWHMNNDRDVRSLMSIVPNTEWWSTVLHEYGHIYYFLEYSNDSVPIVLREGANRAYHEAMGSLMGLASLQQPFLEDRGLLDSGVEVDNLQIMLKEALDFVVLIPWSAGVMTDFEHDLYSNELPEDQFNARWWELKEKYQGIAPPNPRGEEFCDAASKTHINNDPAQYYDYAMSNILLFQFHDYIAKNILHQDPHATNYWGHKKIGTFLKKLQHPGATVDWNEHLKKCLGSGMSAQSMLEYFKPLMEWLKEQNKGRTYTLPEKI